MPSDLVSSEDTLLEKDDIVQLESSLRLGCLYRMAYFLFLSFIPVTMLWNVNFVSKGTCAVFKL